MKQGLETDREGYLTYRKGRPSCSTGPAGRGTSPPEMGRDETRKPTGDNMMKYEPKYSTPAKKKKTQT